MNVWLMRVLARSVREGIEGNECIELANPREGRAIVVAAAEALIKVRRSIGAILDLENLCVACAGGSYRRCLFSGKYSNAIDCFAMNRSYLAAFRLDNPWRKEALFSRLIHARPRMEIDGTIHECGFIAGFRRSRDAHAHRVFPRSWPARGYHYLHSGSDR
jgi:hypothetical protein